MVASNRKNVTRASTEDAEPTSVIRLPEAAKEDETPKVHVFSIGDKDYFCPAKVPLRTSLRYMNMVRKQGDVVASDWLAEQMLGEEAYEALLDYEGLTDELYQQVMKRVAEITAGSIEKTPKG